MPNFTLWVLMSKESFHVITYHCISPKKCSHRRVNLISNIACRHFFSFFAFLASFKLKRCLWPMGSHRNLLGRDFPVITIHKMMASLLLMVS